MRPANFTILVVDDEATDRKIIEQAFRRNGVTNPIQFLESGEAATAYLEGRGEYADRSRFGYPSYIITDLKMPHGDGFTVLEHLRSNPERGVVPTVVLSASADPDDIKKSYMLGASCYHRKPDDFEGMRRLLKMLFEYWLSCEVPQVDTTGRRLTTVSEGKLGERIRQE